VDKGAADAAGYMVDGYVGADNKEGGKLAGTMMVKALGGKGKVAVIEGIRGVDNAEARRAGFEKGVEGKLDIVAKESANWKMDEASNKVQSILAAHPDITGIFCANDMMALGAAKAVKQAGKTGKVKIIGYDNIKEAQDAIKAGEMYATIEQHPELMGRYGAKMGVGLLTQFTQKYREFLVPLEAKTK
jgi:ribose transport system substrate-binding protein